MAWSNQESRGGMDSPANEADALRRLPGRKPSALLGAPGPRGCAQALRQVQRGVAVACGALESAFGASSLPRGHHRRAQALQAALDVGLAAFQRAAHDAGLQRRFDGLDRRLKLEQPAHEAPSSALQTVGLPGPALPESPVHQPALPHAEPVGRARHSAYPAPTWEFGTSRAQTGSPVLTSIRVQGEAGGATTSQRRPGAQPRNGGAGDAIAQAFEG